MSEHRQFSLAAVRTDGWFERIGETIAIHRVDELERASTPTRDPFVRVIHLKKRFNARKYQSGT